MGKGDFGEMGDKAPLTGRCPLSASWQPHPNRANVRGKLPRHPLHQASWKVEFPAPSIRGLSWVLAYSTKKDSKARGKAPFSEAPTAQPSIERAKAVDYNLPESQWRSTLGGPRWLIPASALLSGPLSLILSSLAPPS